MKFKVTVTNTGAKKQVAGLDATESILKMTMEAKDQQSGQTGNMAMTNDMWMAPEIPGYSEVRDFNARMAAKMSTMYSGSMPSSMSPQMLKQQPGMFSGMADMAKEMSKLKGVPVSQVMRMGTTADGAPLPAASEAPLPPSNGPNAGDIANQAANNAANSASDSATSNAASHIGVRGFGSRRQLWLSQEEAGTTGRSARSGDRRSANLGRADGVSVEMTGFSSSSVDPARFDVPAGYARVASEYQKSPQ